MKGAISHFFSLRLHGIIRPFISENNHSVLRRSLHNTSTKVSHEIRKPKSPYLLLYLYWIKVVYIYHAVWTQRTHSP